MTLAEIINIHEKPLLELVFEAAKVHREHHNPREVQVSTLLSIKTGGCPEDCAYCPQAARYHTDVEAEAMMTLEEVKKSALVAKANGSSRLCMGAAWRNIEDGEDFDQVLEMVKTVNALDMEVCCTLGMMTEMQAKKLRQAGLYAYNHNIDSSNDFYKEIISTRTFDDRLKTIENARKADLTVCSGGIIGMGESVEDRCAMLLTLAQMDPQPESVPINGLVAVKGTPLEDQNQIPIWDMIRMVATARIVMPKTAVRLSAGRTAMSVEGQALCFMAGANSIFSGDKLLTTPNPSRNADMEMFEILGLQPMESFAKGDRPADVKYVYTDQNDESKAIWERPKHRLERNVEYAKLGKKSRNEADTFKQ